MLIINDDKSLLYISGYAMVNESFAGNEDASTHEDEYENVIQFLCPRKNTIHYFNSENIFLKQVIDWKFNNNYG